MIRTISSWLSAAPGENQVEFKKIRTRGTQLLIIGMALIYSAEVYDKVWAYYLFALWPTGTGVPMEFWQVFTYAFLHGSYWHLCINALLLWMFGSAMESTWGTRPLLWLFVASAMFAGYVHVGLAAIGVQESQIPIVGASGGISGIMAAYAVCYPRQKVLWLLPPMKIPTWLAIGALVAVYLAFAIGHYLPGIAHDVHLAGVAFGTGCALVWRLRRRYRRLSRESE